MKLNQKDIESLEWVQSQFGDMDFNPVFHYKGNGRLGTLIVNHITRSSYVENITIFEPIQGGIVFKGTCQTKAQLRKIMRQTKIRVV